MSQRAAILCLAFGQTIVWAGLYYIFAALLLQWDTVEAWPKTGLTLSFTGFVRRALPFAVVQIVLALGYVLVVMPMVWRS